MKQMVGIFEVKDVTEDLTGRLENWSIDSKTYPGYTVVRGLIYDDIRRRWRPGEVFRSSALVGDSFESCKEGDTVRTLNSKYLLGKPWKEI